MATLSFLPALPPDYIRALVRDIESGTLEGADWWRQVHERGFGRVPPPFAPDDSLGQGE